MGLACTMLACAAIVLLATSCHRLKPTSAGISVESYPQTQVRVNSVLFGGWFKVVQSAVARGDNGLLQATITVASLKNSDCQIEYRYRWLDTNGIEVTSGASVWRPLSVGAMERKALTGIAPAKNASDFVLDVRFAYKSTRF